MYDPKDHPYPKWITTPKGERLLVANESEESEAMQIVEAPKLEPKTIKIPAKKPTLVESNPAE